MGEERLELANICWNVVVVVFFFGNATYRKHVTRQITYFAISALLINTDRTVKLSANNRKFTCQTFWQHMKSRATNDRLACQDLTQQCFFKVYLPFRARPFFSWRLEDQLDLRHVMKKKIKFKLYSSTFQINVLFHRCGFSKQEPSGAQWSRSVTFRVAPFVVHYEKPRIHLRELTTNSAKMHSWAPRSEHLHVTP